jgi:hypothetical protein
MGLENIFTEFGFSHICSLLYHVWFISPVSYYHSDEGFFLSILLTKTQTYSFLSLLLDQYLNTHHTPSESRTATDLAKGLTSFFGSEERSFPLHFFRYF